jgi:hypothetical protein
LFWTLSLGNTVILNGCKFQSFFNICCTDHLDIPSCHPCWFTGASLQRHSDSASVLWRMHWLRPTTFSLQHWTINIKLVIKFTNCFEWRRPSCLKMAWNPPLCDHNTSCFSKEQRCFYSLLYRQSSFVSHLV